MNTTVENEPFRINQIEFSISDLSVGLIVQNAKTMSFYLVNRIVYKREKGVEVKYVEINTGLNNESSGENFVQIIRDGIYLPVKSCSISNVEYFSKTTTR